MDVKDEHDSYAQLKFANRSPKTTEENGDFLQPNPSSEMEEGVHVFFFGKR